MMTRVVVREPEHGPERMQTLPPLLIIGGGVAGLGAADEALGAGSPAVVVERAGEIGGLLRTDRRDGFCFDRGGHRFITALPWVQDRITELLGDRLLARERRSLVFLDGTTVAYPLELEDLVRRLGIGANLRAFGSYLAARGRERIGSRAKARDANSLEEWLRGRFGDYLYRRVFEGYSEKLWGVHPSQISAEWAPERISVPDLGAFLRQMLWPRRSTPRTWARRYLYPRTGIGEIPEALAARIEERGGEIRTSTVVTRLEVRSGGWRATLRTPNGLEQLDVRAIVSTIPLPSLCPLLPDAPEPPPLRWRGLRFTNIALEHPVPLDATWIYQPDPASRFTRVQVPAARSPEMVPPGRGSVQLEEPWSGDPSRAGDDERVRLAEGFELLRQLGVTEGVPRFSFTTVEPRAYPMYEGNARSVARRMVTALENRPGLALAGRQGRFHYSFLDRAYAEGVNATRRLLDLPEFAIERDAPAGDPIPVEASSIV